MLVRISLLFTILACSFLGVKAQVTKPVKAFKVGEKLTYQAYYNWGLIWVHAGDVQFTVNHKLYRNQSVYNLEATGNSLKTYDWMYKVRERFQSLADPESMLPLWYERNSQEGSYKAYENYVFANKHVCTTVENSEKKRTRDTISASGSVFDVLSAIYYCRNIDFEKYKLKEKIPVRTVMDGKIYPLYLRYLGKETIKVHQDKKQQYRCIKFSALVVEGTIFKGGEDIYVWVTDDDNRIPVLVQAKILVGSVKAYLNSMEGVKNEIRARVD
ncbi:MAG: DUF3108 domain-containing protein [Bacteroidota bacterium]|nr:DUF3108 domain-containing protein [Bacteroidota bacterium]